MRAASARPRPARTRSSRAAAPRGRASEPSRTWAATSAMCTHTRVPPVAERSAEIASSKSRALAGSIVNVGKLAQVAPLAAASRSTPLRRPRAPRARAPRSKPRRRPRSSISASITSRATSGRPIRRSTRAARAAPAGAGRARCRRPRARRARRGRADDDARRAPPARRPGADRAAPNSGSAVEEAPAPLEHGDVAPPRARRACAPPPRCAPRRELT